LNHETNASPGVASGYRLGADSGRA